MNPAVFWAEKPGLTPNCKDAQWHRIYFACWLLVCIPLRRLELMRRREEAKGTLGGLVPWRLGVSSPFCLSVA